MDWHWSVKWNKHTLLLACLLSPYTFSFALNFLNSKWKTLEMCVHAWHPCPATHTSLSVTCDLSICLATICTLHPYTHNNFGPRIYRSRIWKSWVQVDYFFRSPLFHLIHAIDASAKMKLILVARINDFLRFIYYLLHITWIINVLEKIRDNSAFIWPYLLLRGRRLFVECVTNIAAIKDLTLCSMNVWSGLQQI